MQNPVPRSLRRRASLYLHWFLQFSFATLIVVMIWSSDGLRQCNPDAVSVFTNHRECHVPGYVPRGPLLP